MINFVFKGGVVLGEMGLDEDKFRTFSSKSVDPREKVSRF